MRKSVTIGYFLLAFIAGILIRSQFALQLNILFAVALGSIAATFLIFIGNFKHRLVIAKLLLGVFFLFLGCWRVQEFLPALSDEHIANYNGQVAEFAGRVVREPDARDNSINYQIDVAGLTGDALVFGHKFPKYEFNDWLKVQCRLEAPVKIENFDYPGFLAKGSIYSVCFRPQLVERVSCQEGSHALVETSDVPDCSGSAWINKLIQPAQGWLISSKQKYKSVIDQTINFPASAFLDATLLGLRREMPQDLQEAFADTGTSHIMAVSGMHIVILAAMIYGLARGLKIAKRKAFVFVVILLLFFIGLIGFQASALRALVFGLVAILGQVAERPVKPWLLLLWAAAILLLINPLLLVHDIGFQLSFLAVLGLGYLGPWFKKFFSKLPNNIGLRDILVMTMSAQIFVLPWIMYKFGSLSLIAPLANILVLPAVPLIMGLGFALIIVGLVFLPLAQALGWVLWVLVGYVLLVIDLLAQVPLGNLATSLPLWGAALAYAIMFVFIYQPTRRFIIDKLTVKKFKEKKITANDTETITEVIDLTDYETGSFDDSPDRGKITR